MIVVIIYLLKHVFWESGSFGGTGEIFFVKWAKNLLIEWMWAENNNNEVHFEIRILGFWISGFWRQESEIFFEGAYIIVSYINRFASSSWRRIYMTSRNWISSQWVMTCFLGQFSQKLIYLENFVLTGKMFLHIQNLHEKLHLMSEKKIASRGSLFFLIDFYKPISEKIEQGLAQKNCFFSDWAENQYSG